MDIYTWKLIIGAAELIAGIVLVALPFGEWPRWSPLWIPLGLFLIYGGALTAIAE